MSSEERQQILKMVEDGKVSADEAMKLMKALDESSVEMEIIEAPLSALGTGAPASSSGPEAESNSKKPNAPEFEEVADRARRIWQIPLWIGVTITVLSVLDVHISQHFQLRILVLFRVASTHIGNFDDGIVREFPNLAMVVCECRTSGWGMAAQHRIWVSTSTWISKLVSPQLWKQH